MQKNDKSYTFLLSQSSKKGVYIRRISISKNILHFGSVGVFLFIGMIALGIGLSGLVRTTVFAKSLESIPASAHMASVAAQNVPQETASFDYSRPTAGNYTANSGGPEIPDENDADDSALESQIRLVKSSMLPGNVPNMWAHLGKINNEFGFRRNPFGGRSYEFHAGMDIDGERGDLVIAPGSGNVIKAAWSGGYGNMIEIDHGNGITTRYGHLSKIDVAVGDTVTRGQLIGYVGSTGRSTGPHLHFEFRLNDKSINPRHFLPQEPIEIGNAAK